jgi:hypothetical protein
MDIATGAIVKDQSGNNNDLALRGAGHLLGAQGALEKETNGAISFDGATSSSAALRSKDLPFASGQFTFECWLKWKGTGEYFQMIFSQSSGSGPSRRGYLFLAERDKDSTRFQIDGDTYALVGTSKSVVNVYEHWVVTVGQGVATLFRNGKQVGQAPAAVPPSLGEFVLGIDNDGVGSAYNGTIDEVAIYDRPLDIATVAKHYDLGKGNP